MRYIIVDVNKFHAISLWRRLCFSSGFYPEIFIIENNRESIISFIESLENAIIAIPIAFREETHFQSKCTLIVHEKSKIINNHVMRVQGTPASTHVISTLLKQWRYLNVNPKI